MNSCEFNLYFLLAFKWIYTENKSVFDCFALEVSKLKFEDGLVSSKSTVYSLSITFSKNAFHTNMYKYINVYT